MKRSLALGLALSVGLVAMAQLKEDFESSNTGSAPKGWGYMMGNTKMISMTVVDNPVKKGANQSSKVLLIEKTKKPEDVSSWGEKYRESNGWFGTTTRIYKGQLSNNACTYLVDVMVPSKLPNGDKNTMPRTIQVITHFNSDGKSNPVAKSAIISGKDLKFDEWKRFAITLDGWKDGAAYDEIRILPDDMNNATYATAIYVDNLELTKKPELPMLAEDFEGSDVESKWQSTEGNSVSLEIVNNPNKNKKGLDASSKCMKISRKEVTDFSKISQSGPAGAAYRGVRTSSYNLKFDHATHVLQVKFLKPVSGKMFCRLYADGKKMSWKACATAQMPIAAEGSKEWQVAYFDFSKNYGPEFSMEDYKKGNPVLFICIEELANPVSLQGAALDMYIDDVKIVPRSEMK